MVPTNQQFPGSILAPFLGGTHASVGQTTPTLRGCSMLQALDLKDQSIYLLQAPNPAVSGTLSLFDLHRTLQGQHWKRKTSREASFQELLQLTGDLLVLLPELEKLPLSPGRGARFEVMNRPLEQLLSGGRVRRTRPRLGFRIGFHTEGCSWVQLGTVGWSQG